MSTRSRRPGSKVGPILPLVVSASALLGACGDGATPPDYIAEELEAAKAQLRDHARLRTFEAGKLFGEAWVVRAPDDAELRGLYAYQLVGWGLSKEIHEQADAVWRTTPGIRGASTPGRTRTSSTTRPDPPTRWPSRRGRRRRSPSSRSST